ncbi:MAG: hypothetical protein ACTSPV_08630 [Candidatus Hodarchaeales archaeon]
MRFFSKKTPSKRFSKKADINKEVIEHIKETKRKMKEKIPQTEGKKEQ